MSDTDMTEPCLEWMKARTKSGGYGVVWVGDKLVRVHRKAWEDAYGPIPDGLFVCHRCDNPPCYRLSHLFLGTNADNVADMIAKGRNATGERSGPSKHPEKYPRGEHRTQARLTDASVRQIRRLGEEGRLLHREIAEQFGVSRRIVDRVIRREIWTHVSDEATSDG